MLLEYRRYREGGIDKKACWNRFVNAAVALAQMQFPNPFPTEFSPNRMNAAKTPEEGTIVTGVKEE